MGLVLMTGLVVYSYMGVDCLLNPCGCTSESGGVFTHRLQAQKSWESQSPGALRACSDQYRDGFTFLVWESVSVF